MANNNILNPQNAIQRRRKASKLCMLSLVFAVIVPVAILLTTYLTFYMRLDDRLGIDYNFGLIFGVCSLFYIAGFVLMIIARVKYRKSIFATVLMFVYIGLAVAVGCVVFLFVGVCQPIIQSC